MQSFGVKCLDEKKIYNRNKENVFFGEFVEGAKDLKRNLFLGIF